MTSQPRATDKVTHKMAKMKPRRRCKGEAVGTGAHSHDCSTNGHSSGVANVALSMRSKNTRIQFLEATSRMTVARSLCPSPADALRMRATVCVRRARAGFSSENHEYSSSAPVYESGALQATGRSGGSQFRPLQCLGHPGGWGTQILTQGAWGDSSAVFPVGLCSAAVRPQAADVKRNLSCISHRLQDNRSCFGKK